MTTQTKEKIDIDSLTAGRELDELIQKHVIGNIFSSHRPLYSSDISAAWEVLGKMRKKLHDVEVKREVQIFGYDPGDGDTGWSCGIQIDSTIPIDKNPWKYYASGDTAPEAICKAALKSVIKHDNSI